MGRDFDVIISGASFAGLAMARALSVALGDGVRIAIVDRVNPSDRPTAGTPRAFALSAGSRRMLEVLGVWGQVAPDAQPVSRIAISDSELEASVRPFVLSYENEIDDGEPASLIVPDASLGSALRGSVLGDENVSMLAPMQAMDVESRTGGARVSFADGRELRCGLVIAAEGRRSALRESAGIKLVSWDYEQLGIVTTVRHERPHDGVAVQHFLPGGPFAILPLTGNRSCITWSEDKREALRILDLDDDGFEREVDKRFGGRLGRIEVVSGRQSWPLSMHLARSYVAGRLVLIGDSAHGVHPLAGQGLNLGLRDVAALSECVCEGVRLGLDVGDGEALARYERWRRFDSTVSAFAFDGLNRLFSNDWTLLRAARDTGLSIVDKLPGLKRMFVTEAAGVRGELPRLLKGEAI